MPKRRSHLTHEQRNKVLKDGLSDMPTKEVIKKHKISQATLYHLMKTGGRFGSVRNFVCLKSRLNFTASSN